MNQALDTGFRELREKLIVGTPTDEKQDSDHPARARITRGRTNRVDRVEEFSEWMSTMELGIHSS